MDYDALIRDLRSSAKAFRENSVYDSEGDPIRLIVQADEADRAAAAIADLRARNDALVKYADHDDECDANHAWGGKEPVCNCGLSEVLAANREG